MELKVLEIVAQLRRELPGLGLHKLYKYIYQTLLTKHISMGRDKLNTLLRNRRLLITRNKKGPRTTQSNHMCWKYPDLAKTVVTARSEQLWVADITYLSISYDFNYLSVITDAYSRRIMGYCLHPYLTNEGTINALKISLNNRITDMPLMHHSDRGVQYCIHEYVKLLNKEHFAISMTQHGEVYENRIAERINGILKTEFSLNRVFKSRVEALLAVRIAVQAYNNVRPDMSCSNLVPAIAHETAVPLVKYWKNRRKKKTIVQLLNQQK